MNEHDDRDQDHDQDQDQDHDQDQNRESDQDDLEFQLESRLMSHGVYVTALETTDAGYDVEYESLAADEGAVPHREIGRVINVFRDLHPDDWEGVRIEGTVTDLEGRTRGQWHVEAAWLEALEAGELSEIDFSERVIDTLVT